MSKRKRYGLLLVLAVMVCLLGLHAQAASYTDWSAWSTTQPSSATGRQIQTQTVVTGYNMEVYLTQQPSSPYYRQYRSYSVLGNTSLYRTSYGQFHYTTTFSKAVLNSATKIAAGGYVSGSGVNGYNKDTKVCYQVGSNVPYFIVSEITQTQYRYRDVVAEQTETEAAETETSSAGDTSGTPSTGNSGSSSSGDAGSSSSDNSGNSSSGDSGSSADSSAGSNPGGSTQTPSVPSISVILNIDIEVSLTCTTKGVQVSWNAVDGCDGYYVYRNGKKIATVTGGKHTYTDKKAKTNGKKYTYRVRCFVKDGSTIRAGKKSAKVVIRYLIRVKINVCTPKSNAIKVSWAKNSKCDGYEICYSTSADFSNAQTRYVKKPGTTSCTLKGLTYTTYYIRIRSYVTVNGVKVYSTWSKTITGMPKAPVYTYAGTITDATTGSALKGAKLYFRKGSNKRKGTVCAQTKTDRYGKYSVKLEQGIYTIQVTKSGYVTYYITITVNISVTIQTNAPISMSKKLDTDKYRIILTWGATPYDLDSHLSGSSGYGGYYHVYFSQKNGYYRGALSANLDIDDTSSYGPETVTLDLSKNPTGTYVYYVHDFSNKSSTYSRALANSGATVTIIKGSKQIAVYHVPNAAGTAWKVFGISNGKLVTYNTMSYISNAATYYTK